MPSCEISDCAQMSKTIIAARHFGLGGRESLETAVSIVVSILTTVNFKHLIYVLSHQPSDKNVQLCFLSN